MYVCVCFSESQNKRGLFPHTSLIDWLLGAFNKLRKATIRFVMSVCPSDRTERLGFHWTDIREILHLGIFSKKFLRKLSYFIKI